MAEGKVPVVVLDPEATDEERDEVMTLIGGLSPSSSLALGDGWGAVAIGDGVRAIDTAPIANLRGVRRIVEVGAPYRLASREAMELDTSVRTNGVGASVGGGEPIAVMVDCQAPALSDARLGAIIETVGAAGASIVFAGEVSSVAGYEHPAMVDAAALERIREAASRAGMAVCVEVSDHRRIDEVADPADLLQVGSGNMQDFELLRELGRVDRPVLLKRGYGATVEEFILGAEYVLSHGNGRVILCESGIRTFDSVDRPRFEINAVPVIKRATHLPLMADPASATARSELVPAMVKAAVAAGADGVVVGVHDGRAGEGAEAALDVPTFLGLLGQLGPIADAVGRRPPGPGIVMRGVQDG
jgi:3-deoxy-7-phosphoheptulonate synthase